MAEDRKKNTTESKCKGCNSEKITPDCSAPNSILSESIAMNSACVNAANNPEDIDNCVLDCRLDCPLDFCEAGKDTVFSTLVSVSVKTLFYLFLCLTVLAVCFSQLFPYQSMRFYYDMQDYPTALAYAKKYAKTEGNKRTEVLLYGIEMSEALLFESVTEKNAEYLFYFTEELLKLPIAEFDSRCKALDDYYQNAYKNGEISIVAAVGLYSFRDYVMCKNVAARTVLGKADYIPHYWDSDVVGHVYHVSCQWLEGMLRLVIDGVLTSIPDELPLIFNMLSENMAYGGSLVFDSKLEINTPLYSFAAEIIAPEEDTFSYLDECQSADGLERLYFVKAAANFAETAIDFFEKVGQNAESKAAREKFVVTSNGKSISISDYYGELLREYKAN